MKNEKTEICAMQNSTNSQCANSSSGISEFEINFIQKLNYSNIKDYRHLFNPFKLYAISKYPNLNFNNFENTFSVSEGIELINNIILENPFLTEIEKSDLKYIFSRMYDIYFEYTEFRISKIKKRFLLINDLKDLLNTLYNIHPKNSAITINDIRRINYNYLSENKILELEKLFSLYSKRENSLPIEFGGEDISLDDIEFYEFFETVKNSYSKMDIKSLIYNALNLKATCLKFLCNTFNVQYYYSENRSWKNLKKLFYKRLIRNISPVVIDTVFLEFKKLYFECVNKIIYQNIGREDYLNSFIRFLEINFEVSEYLISETRKNVFKCLQWGIFYRDEEWKSILREFCNCYSRKLKKHKSAMEIIEMNKNEFDEFFGCSTEFDG